LHFHHAPEVPQRRAGGVGIAAIGHRLDLCGVAGDQASLEILADLDHEERAAVVDPCGDFLCPAKFGLAAKDFGPIQAR
jgi:hypothetical protein